MPVPYQIDVTFDPVKGLKLAPIKDQDKEKRRSDPNFYRISSNLRFQQGKQLHMFLPSLLTRNIPEAELQRRLQVENEPVRVSLAKASIINILKAHETRIVDRRLGKETTYRFEKMTERKNGAVEFVMELEEKLPLYLEFNRDWDAKENPFTPKRVDYTFWLLFEGKAPVNRIYTCVFNRAELARVLKDVGRTVSDAWNAHDP